MATTTSSERELKRDERRTLALLGLPTLGLALAITTVSTYLPVLARAQAGSTVAIGVIIGAEGFLALIVPMIVGPWSDRLRTPLGGRLPFLLAGVPGMAVALVLMPFAGSLGWIALIVGVFFTAYFIAYEPYRALYPDLFPAEVAGRAQSTQSLWRGAGTGLALVGGGLLLALARPAPFLAAAALLVGTAATFAVALARRSPSDASSEQRGPRAREVAVQVLGPVREHPALRSYLYANALWELSLAALKTFVVLYLTAGIGLSQLGATAAIAAAVPFIVAGALVSGKLADRYGRISVLRIAVPLYGVGLLVPGIVSAPWAVAIVAPAVAFGGGTIMTLPYAVLMPLMPSDEHGALTGFYSVSRGLGVMVGPLLAGLAIQLLEQSFKSTHGYQAVWLVCGAAMLASVWCVHRLCQQGGDRADLRRSAG